MQITYLISIYCVEKLIQSRGSPPASYIIIGITVLQIFSSVVDTHTHSTSERKASSMSRPGTVQFRRDNKTIAWKQQMLFSANHIFKKEPCTYIVFLCCLRPKILNDSQKNYIFYSPFPWKQYYLTITMTLNDLDFDYNQLGTWKYMFRRLTFIMLSGCIYMAFLTFQLRPIFQGSVTMATGLTATPTAS